MTLMKLYSALMHKSPNYSNYKINYVSMYELVISSQVQQ